ELRLEEVAGGARLGLRAGAPDEKDEQDQERHGPQSHENPGPVLLPDLGAVKCRRDERILFDVTLGELLVLDQSSRHEMVLREGRAKEVTPERECRQSSDDR